MSIFASGEELNTLPSDSPCVFQVSATLQQIREVLRDRPVRAAVAHVDASAMTEVSGKRQRPQRRCCSGHVGSFFGQHKSFVFRELGVSLKLNRKRID